MENAGGNYIDISFDKLLGLVAVSITNITDILAFLIGCITDLPGIEVFCLYAFASVTFCYLYQLTYFAGKFLVEYM